MRSPFRRRRPISQDERAPAPAPAIDPHVPPEVMPIGCLALWELLEDQCDLMYGPGMDGEQRAMTN